MIFTSRTFSIEPQSPAVLRVHHDDCVGSRVSVALSSRRTEGSRNSFALYKVNEDKIPPFVGMTGEARWYSPNMASVEIAVAVY